MDWALTVPENLAADTRLMELVMELATRANAGEARALAELRTLLDQHPALWDGLGDLAGQVERAWIKRTLGGGRNEITTEAIHRTVSTLRQELLGPSPTTLERLLVTRIIVCWLHVQDADLRYARLLGEDHAFEAGDAYQRRQDRAQRRYLHAIKALAQVRKLTAETVQINIAANGGQQVNVGSLAAFFRGQAGQREQDGQ